MIRYLKVVPKMYGTNHEEIQKDLSRVTHVSVVFYLHLGTRMGFHIVTKDIDDVSLQALIADLKQVDGVEQVSTIDAKAMKHTKGRKKPEKKK